MLRLEILLCLETWGRVWGKFSLGSSPTGVIASNATLSSKKPLKQRLLMLVKWCLCVCFVYEVFYALGEQLLAFPGHAVRSLLAPCSISSWGGKYLLFVSRVPTAAECTIAQCLKIPPCCFPLGARRALSPQRVALHKCSCWVESSMFQQLSRLLKMQADFFSLLSPAQHAIPKVTAYS